MCVAHARLGDKGGIALVPDYLVPPNITIERMTFRFNDGYFSSHQTLSTVRKYLVLLLLIYRATVLASTNRVSRCDEVRAAFPEV